MTPLSIYIHPPHFSNEFLPSSPINPSIFLNPSEKSKKGKKKKRDLIRKSEGMERSNSTSAAASGFHGYHQQRLLTKSSSSPGMMISTSTNKPILEDNSVDSTACTVREQDRFMPIANVIRIMRKVLPTHAKISDDAKETIQECVSEYISFVTSEANERCQREQRKTITAEDVLWAMNKLGFDDYIEPLSLYLRRYREFEGDRVSIRGDPLVRRTMDMSNTGYAPAFHMGHHHQQGLYGAPMGGVGGGYYRDNGSNVNGNQNQSTPLASYDPYAPRN